MSEDYEEYIQQLTQELDIANREKRQLANAQMSLFGNQQDENLIKWQLDLREDLDRIYHLLKGHQIKQDERGNVIYVEPDDSSLKPFNEFGTQLIMNILSFYLNRNTILSNYDEDTINYKVYDFGCDLVDLVFNRYEEMMMTTTFELEFKKIYPEYELIAKPDGKMLCKLNGNIFPVENSMVQNVENKIKEHLLGKMKMYPMIVRELVDSVHSAYLRALNGEEKKSLREARTVSQMDNTGRMPNIPMVHQNKQFKLFRPSTWG